MQFSNMKPTEVRITSGPGGRILTHANVWSRDSQWIVYDTRSDEAGEKFNGLTIEMVHIHTGEVRVLYESSQGAHCGVATFSPVENKVVFIRGPVHPTLDWSYAPWHRRGVLVDTSSPGRAENLDARDMTPPFTPGALRGGTHLHLWDGGGDWISFTYEDDVLARLEEAAGGHDLNQRNVGLSVPDRPVKVGENHPRNQDGTAFSVLVTRTTAQPRAGSDDIVRASEEAWVGAGGYLRSDGTRQRRALAFQGQVLTEAGETISEVFLVDVPEDVTEPGEGPLEGTERSLPYPPKGAVQRRLTRTSGRRHPGLQGPRHWLRSAPDGSVIAFLMKDEEGEVQLWTISPLGGEPKPLTRNRHSIASAFTWSPDGSLITHVMDNSVCVTERATGQTHRLTARCEDALAPRPEACVFSPDGKRIAFVRRIPSMKGASNQICVVTLS